MTGCFLRSHCDRGKLGQALGLQLEAESLRESERCDGDPMDPMDPMAGLGVFMLCNAKCPGGIKGAGILGTARHGLSMHFL